MCRFEDGGEVIDIRGIIPLYRPRRRSNKEDPCKGVSSKRGGVPLPVGFPLHVGHEPLGTFDVGMSTYDKTKRLFMLAAKVGVVTLLLTKKTQSL